MVVHAQADEIVVTARKKEESLQEVPLSIAAFSAEQMGGAGHYKQLWRRRVHAEFLDLAAGRPPAGPGRQSAACRTPVRRASRTHPISSTAYSSRRRSRPRTRLSMERVEVLRGPQSATFGRATFAGAVNYITRRPTNDMTGEVFLRAGSSDEALVSGWWSGPIVEDKLLFLVSGAYDKYGGQWNNNLQPDSVFVNGPDPGNCVPFTTIPNATLVNNFRDISDCPESGRAERRW